MSLYRNYERKATKPRTEVKHRERPKSYRLVRRNVPLTPVSQQHPTKEEFFDHLAALSPEVDKHMNVAQFCNLVGIDRHSYYGWLRRETAPSLLTRRALLSIMREMAKADVGTYK